MKKLKLRAIELGATEVLTRSQLRNVLGGGGMETTMPGGGGETTNPFSMCTAPGEIQCSGPVGGYCPLGIAYYCAFENCGNPTSPVWCA